MKISKGHLDEIMKYCQKEFPREACGIIAGKNELVEKVYYMTNTSDTPKTCYLMKPEEQFNVFKDIRHFGMRMLAIFHSHLYSEAFPSKRDCEMSYYPEASCIIVSLQDFNKPEIRAFKIIENNILEVGIVIEEDLELDFKEKILSEMINYFGDDIKRINHVKKVLFFAEKILQQESGADRIVVIISSILHDIGIRLCELKYNSTDGQLQEKEGPPIVREILQKVGIKQEVVDEVCKIIACHHSPCEINTLNYKILWDADWLVNIEDEIDLNNKEKLEDIINKIFLTSTGKQIAKEKYLSDSRGV